MRKRTRAREYALQLLYQVDVAERSPSEMYVEFWKAFPCENPVREFAERLVTGTLEKLPEIDKLLARYTENWNLERMAVVDRNILRFATYELRFMDDSPPKVSINEAVNLAKKYSQEESGKFVNGVLDKICHRETTKLNKI